MSRTGLNVSGAAAGRLASPSQFGPSTRIPAAAELGPDGLEQPGAGADALAEPGAEDHRDPHPGRGAVPQHLRDQLGPHHHQRQVNRPGHVQDRRVRRQPLHLAGRCR